MFLIHRLSRALPLGILAGVLVSGPAAARMAVPDQTFLEDQTGQLEALRDSLLTRSESPPVILDGVRQVLVLRQEALQQLEERLLLTGLDGIETQDLLDDAVVRAIHDLVKNVEIDTTTIDEEEAFLYAEALVGVPPLGESPVGFMVLQFADLAIQASDDVRDGAHIGENHAALLALNAVRHATNLYMSLDEDIVSQDRRATFRQNSVLFRLRCPEDQGGYGIVKQRNRLLPDDAIARVNTLVCTECGDTLMVTFPLILPSALNQRSQKQHLEEKPQAPRGSGGVEP
jgi:hypothetical protein